MLKYSRKFSELINLKKLHPAYIRDSIAWHANNLKRRLLVGDEIVRYGNANRDKKFYVIGRDLAREGLFSIINGTLSHIIFAEKHGCIPVVDMQNYPNIYLREEALHKENAWEYYLEQPGGFTLEDIKDSRHIHRAHSYRAPCYDYVIRWDLLEERNRNTFLVFKDYFKRYIRFNDSVKRYFADDYQRVIGNKKDGLGIICRGTDYTVAMPHGVPIQPDTDAIIKKAEEVIKQYHCSYIFLATEDDRIYRELKRYFGDMLVTSQQNRFDPGVLKEGEWLADIKSERKDNNYYVGFEYLSSLNILSKSRYFLGSLNTGTIGAQFMTEGFDYSYIWHLGRCP